MKAIETEYKGYRFRSRLEARWALFFDSAGIPWQYEPEGFDLDGDWYLPDFLLPQQEIWVEIKPTLPDEREVRVAVALERGQPDRSVIILAGDCWPDEYRALWITPNTEDAVNYACWNGYQLDGYVEHTCLAKCRRCDGLSLIQKDESLPGRWHYGIDIGDHTCGDHERQPVEFDFKHYRDSRRYRFDHRKAEAGKR